MKSKNLIFQIANFISHVSGAFLLVGVYYMVYTFCVNGMKEI